MEVAVQSAISVTTIVHTTLVTTIAHYKSFPTLGKNSGSTLSNRFEPGLQGGKTRQKTVWITFSDTSPHSNTNLSTSSSAIQSASPSVVKDAHSLSSPVATVQGLSSNVVVTTSLPVAPPDPSNRCPLKPDPMDQQSSSYELCQKTVSFGGLCCTPFQSGPSATLSTAVSSTPTSTLVSPTSTPAPSSPPTTTLSQPSLTLHPDTAPSIEPATKPSASRSPLPTELTTTRTPVKIIPIIIPCALAGAGIVAFGIWCVLWRDKRKSTYNPSTSVNNAPKIINGQKVFRGGNFAVAAAFRPGIGEMARKDREGLDDEEKPAWKAGYRKYRDSKLPGSGLLKGTEVKGLAM